MAVAKKDPSESVKSEQELYTLSVKALAEALGVSRPTIYAWFKLEENPGEEPDGRYSLSKWRAFAQSIGTKTEAGQTRDKAALQAEELAIIVKTRALALAIKEGEYTANHEIGDQITARVQETLSVLRAKFERELPPLYTGRPLEDLDLNKAAIDEVCDRLSRPLPCQEPDDE